MSNFDRNAPVWGAGRAQQTSAVEMDQGLRSFMLGVYNNMSIGLAITGLFAIGISMFAIAGYTPTGKVAGLTPLGVALFASPLKWVVMLAPLAFIFFFSFKAESMSSSAARSMFFAFAAVMGVSMASIFLVYTSESIGRVFFITAAAFGGLSLFGYTTKKSLSGMGSFLIMGLIGLVIASLVNIFLASSALGFAISVIGVLVFAGLTAWDTQRLKEMYLYSDLDAESAAKLSVNGALSLYLNFVNMFQMLLSLFGNRQE
ncbi:Bax inhibitor-1/YccA family protein [Bosea sp. BH3]|uniref:Bax inhibitor-1/YccA family protein n=1 Tax=Bosea sp. BH3 TaxID=2871701 RepID=UPI0021CAF122|nr:Bax inhibitor-1/YccA family protein [Bosea sp. BH3]MCU4182618.1 Bax inhibitor-1/YccA family protein [Bosea sp. BH3]